MRIVLSGPPGAGKGTQGALLSRAHGVPRLATGDILREARRSGTPLGERAQQYMDAGELVPDPVILGIVREVLMSPSARPGFVLDGFPRTVEQAKGLEAILEELDVALDAVVEIDVPDEEIVRRLSSRRVCADCGSVADPGEDECPGCGGTRLTAREDDRPETVRHRLIVYRERTAPVLSWYEATSVPVVRIDGTGSVAEVMARVSESLDL